MKKYVVFLAAGKWQEPWLRYLKDRGHAIILVDPNDNPVGRKYCDIYVKCDVKNWQAIQAFIEENEYEIEFFTSDQTDVSTIPVAHLTEYFGTPGNSLESVQRFSNKYISREFVQHHFGDEHLPLYAKISSADKVIHFMEQVGSKVMIKPVDAQSSRGIFVVDPQTEAQKIDAFVNEALAFSQQNYVLVEQFVDGHEITVEGVITPNGHKILAASGKKHFRTGIASDLEYPLAISPALWGRISNFHNAVVNRTKLGMGITHTEYLVDAKRGTFYLVEMACRGGGSLIPSTIVPWVCGVTPYDILYTQLTGNKIDESVLKSFGSKRAATLHFFEFPSGKVESISGITEARLLGGVHRLEMEFDVGDVIHPAVDDRGRQGFAIILGDSPQHVHDIKKEIYATISIEYAELEEPVTA